VWDGATQEEIHQVRLKRNNTNNKQQQCNKKDNIMQVFIEKVAKKGRKPKKSTTETTTKATTDKFTWATGCGVSTSKEFASAIAASNNAKYVLASAQTLEIRNR